MDITQGSDTGHRFLSGYFHSLEHLTLPIGLVNDLALAQTVDESLQGFGKWVGTIVAADRFSVALRHGPDQLCIRHLGGLRNVNDGRLFDINSTIIGRIFRNRLSEIVYTEEHQSRPGAGALATSGFVMDVIAPLVSQGQCFGTLNAAFLAQRFDVVETQMKTVALARCLAGQLHLIEQMRELRHQSEVDPLTEAMNRRTWDPLAKRLWSTWLAHGTPMSVVAIDLDHFKAINDSHGHAAGDDVLSGIAKTLRQDLRKQDTLFRMGGEEFSLLLADTNEHEAARLAQRICETIGAAPYETSAGRIAVTVSVGVATSAIEDATFAALSARADAALYDAKNKGRDRVVIADRAA